MILVPGKLYEIKRSFYFYDVKSRFLEKGQILFLLQILKSNQQEIQIKFLFLSNEIIITFSTFDLKEDVLKHTSSFLEEIK